MNIAHLTPYFYPVTGGMENHVLEITKRLAKKYDITVLTSNIDRKGNLLTSTEKKFGLTIKRLKVKWKISEFASFFPSVFKEVRNYQLVHVHAYRHPHNFAPFFTDSPCIITPHYPVYPFSSLKRKIFTTIFDAFFGKIVFSRYKKIIALTEGEKIWLTKKFGIKVSKIEVIPNGISKEYLRKHNGDTFRKKIGISEAEFLILSVGRIHFSKGFQDLIKAFSMLPEKIKKQSKLVIVGPDAGYLSTLKSLVNELKLNEKVIFTGKISERLKLSAYEACDLFVLPSYWEGFGIVLLEAMAKNKPVMARSSGGQKWVVPEKRFLFNSIADLAKKIEMFFEGRLKKTFNYKDIVREKYLWDKIVDRLEKIYQEVLKS